MTPFAEYFVARYSVPTADLWLSSFPPAWQKKHGYCFKTESCRTKGCERPTERVTAFAHSRLRIGSSKQPALSQLGSYVNPGKEILKAKFWKEREIFFRSCA